MPRGKAKGVLLMICLLVKKMRGKGFLGGLFGRVEGGNHSFIYPQVPFLTHRSDLKPYTAADVDE